MKKKTKTTIPERKRVMDRLGDATGALCAAFMNEPNVDELTVEIARKGKAAHVTLKIRPVSP